MNFSSGHNNPLTDRTILPSSYETSIQKDSDQQLDLQEIVIDLNRRAMLQLKYGNTQACFQLLKNAEDLFKSQRSIMNQQIEVNSPQVALHYLKLAMKYEQQMAIDEVSKCGTLLNICAILSILKRHQEATKYGKQAIIILSEKVQIVKEASSDKKQINEEPEGEIDDIRENQAYQTKRNSTQSNSYHVEKSYLENIYLTLIIAYYNVGVEQEHLQNYSQALDSYQKGLNTCYDQQKLGSSIYSEAELPPIAQTLRQNIEDLRTKLSDINSHREERQFQRDSKRTSSLMHSTGFTSRYNSNLKQSHRNQYLSKDNQDNKHFSGGTQMSPPRIPISDNNMRSGFYMNGKRDSIEEGSMGVGSRRKLIQRRIIKNRQVSSERQKVQQQYTDRKRQEVSSKEKVDKSQFYQSQTNHPKFYQGSLSSQREALSKESITNQFRSNNYINKSNQTPARNISQKLNSSLQDHTQFKIRRSRYSSVERGSKVMAVGYQVNHSQTNSNFQTKQPANYGYTQEGSNMNIQASSLDQHFANMEMSSLPLTIQQQNYPAQQIQSAQQTIKTFRYSAIQPQNSNTAYGKRHQKFVVQSPGKEKKRVAQSSYEQTRNQQTKNNNDLLVISDQENVYTNEQLINEDDDKKSNHKQQKDQQDIVEKASSQLIVEQSLNKMRGKITQLEQRLIQYNDFIKHNLQSQDLKSNNLLSSNQSNAIGDISDIYSVNEISNKQMINKQQNKSRQQVGNSNLLRYYEGDCEVRSSAQTVVKSKEQRIKEERNNQTQQEITPMVSDTYSVGEQNNNRYLL